MESKRLKRASPEIRHVTPKPMRAKVQKLCGGGGE
jgi:hypothetical protein